MSSPSDLKNAAAARPPLDIAALVKEHAGENYELHAEHINPANVPTLKCATGKPAITGSPDKMHLSTSRPGMAKLDNADANAPVHPFNQRIFQEN